ncbi:MAG: formate dehydrogenase accessory sulfurtransferase FdhD [Myxococcota bacterium]
MDRRGITEREVSFVGQDIEDGLDFLVVEEPLEIRAAGETLAVTMRTPGQDRNLALGFLWTEGLIASLADVGSVSHCGSPGEEGYGNTIDVRPGPGMAFDLEESTLRRGTLTTAACGVCGRKTIDDLMARLEPNRSDTAVARDVLARSPEALRLHQDNFAQTGAIHAAALVSNDGDVLFSAEDVGRHNAVDKVLGQLLQKPHNNVAMLVVSGRASFEVVQKAAVGGVPIVVAVSAPSSLAVDLAQEVGITLVGFVRSGRFNVYGGHQRIAL